MMKMTWREILFWLGIYELQATEEEVISEFKSEGKNLPSSEIIRQLVDERIKERREKI